MGTNTRMETRDYNLDIKKLRSDLKKGRGLAAELEDDDNRKGVLESLDTLVNNREYSDVKFVVGVQEKDMETLYAHKAVLAVRSRVFDKMFSQGQGTDTDSDDCGKIKLTDIEAFIFKKFLQYVYTEKFNVDSVDVALGMLYLSIKYMVAALVEECEAYLLTELNYDNVLLVENVAHLLGRTELEAQCWEIMEGKTVQVVQSLEFLELDEARMCRFLKRDEMCLEETRLFQELILWGKHRCKAKDYEVNQSNLRAALGEAIYLIRFPAMSVEDFTSFVVGPVLSKSVLSTHEILNVYHTIGRLASHQHEGGSEFIDCADSKFNAKKRACALKPSYKPTPASRR